MRYPAPAAMSEDTRGPSWASVSSFPMAVERAAGRVLRSAAVEADSRICPGRVSTEPWEKLQSAAKQGRSAGWKRIAWSVGRTVRLVSAWIEL